MSWVIFFIIFIFIASLFDSKPKNRNQRPPAPTRPKPTERVKPTIPLPTKKPLTPTPHSISLPKVSPVIESGVLNVTLTPVGYLSNFERNKRGLLSKAAISSARFKLVHDRGNYHDSKAIKVLLDDVNIGFVRKQGTNGAVDCFCFNGSTLKANLSVNWDGSHLRIESGNDQAETVQTIQVNPFQAFGVLSLWHMSHVDNISSILSNGIVSNDTAHSKFAPRDISNSDVQTYRGRNDPYYHRRLHEYAPTYLSIKNPMLYVKKDMNFYLCILELSTYVVNDNQFLLTDGNAASKETRFFNKMSDLNYLPWNVLLADYWNDFDDGKRKKCAEVLIYPSIDKKYIKAVHCSNFTAKRMVEKNAPSSSVPVKVSPELFF
ncbi:MULTISPECIES: DUF4433 domain-containing protein [unclassified Photobacterium]|uniref:DUF4433 domain-containing protein n=1 Tax=unclassified Photobacterium TaxID=2628852 RepID=UPI001EDEDA51|nr:MULTISPECIES: DUF4433 domain-containing protein [unclassified Photobacterium]MCG3866231.1 DUF4433 domain-containing protein [Photobacterium sp. Ph6]MCG3877748.1 DUF4433 domain-containing protein [Photobacterium sp. Ph5]